MSSYEKYVRKELNFLSFVPVVFSSAMNKQNLEPIIDLAVLVGKQRRERIPTRKLMDVIRAMDHKVGRSKTFAMLISYLQCRDQEGRRNISKLNLSPRLASNLQHLHCLLLMYNYALIRTNVMLRIALEPSFPTPELQSALL